MRAHIVAEAPRPYPFLRIPNFMSTTFYIVPYKGGRVYRSLGFGVWG